MTQQRYKENYTKAPNRQNICLELVRIAASRRQTKALAAFYLLKQLYINSRLYDYRAFMDYYAHQCGVCTKTLYNYLRFLRSQGLVYDSGDNLILAGTHARKRNEFERRKYQITINTQDTLKDIEARLLQKIMERQMIKLAFYKRKQIFEKRTARRRDTIKQCGSENAPGLSLSIRNLKELFNLGTQKTMGVLCTLNTLGCIRTTPSTSQIVGRGTRRDIAKTEGMIGHFYYHNGYIYCRMGDRHLLAENHPKETPLTRPQYIKYYKSTFCKKQNDI